MTPSAHCHAFIAKEEGLRLKPYLDTAGVPTIGYGTIMYPSGKRVTMKDPPITEAQAMEYLQWEIGLKAASVRAFFSKTALTQNQFDSLVSFTYNLGVGALDSRLCKLVKVTPNEQRMQAVETMEDAAVKAWFQKQGTKAVPLITYYFALWCKVTVKDKVTGKESKKISEGLIKRRLREAALFQNG